jgi:tetratricopeptide (TPR) repeat protein
MAVKIFFCYAHEDEALLKNLKTHLKPLQRQGLINMWHDRDISAGAKWEQEISERLNAAQIILLLVSPDFMDSDYCYSIEMKRAVERHEQEEARVIPIILRHVYWQGEPLGKLQALPRDAIPVKSWQDQDEALYNVVEGIHKVVMDLLFQQAYMQGDAYAAIGHYEQALASYEKAISYNPNNANIYIDKGITLIGLRRYKEALIAFEYTISLNVNSTDAHNSRGVALRDFKRCTEVLIAFEQAIILDPSNTQGYVNEALALDELGCYKEALIVFEQAILLDSNLSVPNGHYIKWAKGLLSIANLAFLEVDTTGLSEEDEIIRILLVDCNGNSIFETLLCPDRPVTKQISYITGITDNDLVLAPILSDVWEQVANVLTEKYILSFNLEFDIDMLEAAAKQHDLKMPLVVGECLMLKAMRYSGSGSYSKLSDLCAYINSPLPDYPHRTALDRARGQIALLRAMAKGLTIEEEEPGSFITPEIYMIENDESGEYIILEDYITDSSVIEEPEGYIMPDGYPIPDDYMTIEDYMVDNEIYKFI